MEPYIPNVWRKGDRASAAKFNRLENAVATLSTAVDEPDTGTEIPAFGDPVGQPADVWVPVFGDDFDSPIEVVDPATGVIKFGDGPLWNAWYHGEGTLDDSGHTNNGAKGLGWYQIDQVTQQGSSAFLKATYAPDPSRPNNPYLAGLLQSHDFTPVHGYFEARVRMSYVQGTWPAVWMSAKDTWPPEIDILEQYGEVRDNKVTTWANDVPGQTGSYNGQYINSKDGWIVVAAEWDAEKVVIYYDGVEVARETVRANVPDRPMHLLLDMQIDADQQGIDPAEYPTWFEVDYYRAWAKQEQSQVYAVDEFEGAAGTAPNPALWTVGASGANGQGTVALTGDGAVSMAASGGAWALAPAMYLAGMDNILDFDVYIDLELSSLEEHYFTISTRSNGTINGGSNGPNNAIGVVTVPQTGKFEANRFDWSGNGVSLGVGNVDWSKKTTLRLYVNGGLLKVKSFPTAEVEPEAWALETTMGLDKSLPVIIDPGKLMLNLINGGNGNSHPVKIHRVLVNKAIMPDPIPLTEGGSDGGGDNGGGGTVTPIAPVIRSAAYTLGGGTGIGSNGTQTATCRIPVNLPKKAKRLRLHISNQVGLLDYAQVNGPSITRATFGRRSKTAGAPALALSSVQNFPAGEGSLDNGGEWISGWLTPDWETDDFGWVSFVANYTGTDVSISYSGGAWYGSTEDQASDLSGQGWENYGNTPFQSYIEYEYEDDGSQQVLFLGDSIPEGYVDGGARFGAGPMRNFMGHIDSFPEAYGRHTGNPSILNAYASAKINDWGSASPKWNRFVKMAEALSPDAIVIHLGGNDFFQSQPYTDVIAEMETWLRVVRDKYPRSKIFVMGCIPLLAANAAQLPPFEERVYMNMGFAAIDRSLIDGYIEPDNGLYDPTSGASENIRSKYVSPDGLHLTPHAYEILAAAIQIPTGGGTTHVLTSELTLKE